MQMEHSFSVNAPASLVWAFLSDVPRMAACIPGASNIVPLSDNTYDATVAAKIGPITARFASQVTVLSLDDAAYTGAVEMSGKDVKLGGGVKGRMQMALHGDSPTTVSIVSEVDILGKIGQYGHGMIAKRADAMLLDFASCVRAQLEQSGA